MSGESKAVAIEECLKKWHVVLASTSPRRREIVGKFFEEERLTVEACGFDESTVSRELGPAEYVECMSKSKAEWALANSRKPLSADTLIVTADTMIFRDDTLVGKPEDDAEARRILLSLAGRQHLVLTGVCILGSDGAVRALFHETTQVVFAPLSPSTIDWYISTGEPVGKAGAYGIQGLGSALISEIRGCFWNVMGFPIHRFLQHLGSLSSK